MAADQHTDLIESNQGLVRDIAQRYGQYSLPMDDLIQEGNLGLLQAAREYESDRRTKFSTFATVRIESAILHALVRENRLNERVPPRGRLNDLACPTDNCELASAISDELEALFRHLGKQERMVLELRFGLIHGTDHNYKQVAGILRCTPQRVKVIERRALTKLGEHGREGLDRLKELVAERRNGEAAAR